MKWHVTPITILSHHLKKRRKSKSFTDTLTKFLDGMGQNRKSHRVGTDFTIHCLVRHSFSDGGSLLPSIHPS
jgi:hypothetical protein